MVGGAVAITALLLVAVAAGGQDGAARQAATTEPDVVVIGRRLRLVRLDYMLAGPYLQRCDVEVSSGNARVDGVMCAVLRRCVMAGYREPQPAKRCMDLSIDLFVAGKRRLPEPEPIGAAGPPRSRPEVRPAVRPEIGPASEPLSRPEQAQPAPAPSTPAAPTPVAPDVVVTGERHGPLAGQWRFAKVDSSPSGHLSERRWERCIPEGELAAILRGMLDGEDVLSADGRCGPMKFKFKGDRVSGERSCIHGGARMTTRVLGSFSQDRIVASGTTFLVASTSRPISATIDVPEDDGAYKLAGERTGQCRADRKGTGQQR